VGSGGRHESGDVSCWVLLGACAAHDLHRTVRRRRQGQGDGGGKESSTEHERPLKKREEVEHQRHGETSAERRWELGGGARQRDKARQLRQDKTGTAVELFAGASRG
jgi:hypothetical protein